MNRTEAMVAAQHVGEVAAQHADESDALRRLAPAVASAVFASGLGRLVAPTALGGDAVEPRLLAEVVESIARRDASTAWCVGIGAGTNYLAGLVREDVAKELFIDLAETGVGPFEPTGKATKDGDVFNVSGRWRFSSNCHQGGVLAAGVMMFDGDELLNVDEDGQPRPTLAFFARDQYEIVETWDTVGMRGTGSHDTVVTDVNIGRDHFASFYDTAWPDDAIYRLRPVELLGACLSPVALGIGQAALELVASRAEQEAVQSGPARGLRARFIDDPVAQNVFAQADIRLRAARALLHECLDKAYAKAEIGDRLTREETALLGLAHLEAMTAGGEAVDTAARIIGTASVREHSAMDRLRRDVDTARQHVMFTRSLNAPLGRQRAGIDTVQFPYLPPLGL